ncbi:MAG TPA: magnesium transporter CorA family protein [Meiothermus sp.]|nr:magnesium transporter CorA family protein [Meiothermus sp.]
MHYPLDPDERPRVERENGFLLIIFKTSVPMGDKADFPFDTVPVGLIHAKDALVTVCSSPNTVLADIKQGALRYVSTAKKNRLTLQIFSLSAQHFLAHLRHIEKLAELAEDRLQSSTRNQELLELLKLQKSLVYFMTALRSNEAMMERIRREHLFEMFPDDTDLLNNVLTENLQAIQMTEINTNILSTMMGAFASVISNNLNAVMKFLAVATVVVAIPTLITGIFGMNVKLPLEDTPEALPIILFSALGAVGVVLYILWRRGWL